MLCGSNESKRRSAPAFTMSSRKKPLPDSRLAYPAPCSYDIDIARLRRRSPEFSMGQTLLRPVRFVGPGPGAHSPEQVTAGAVVDVLVGLT